MALITLDDGTVATTRGSVQAYLFLRREGRQEKRLQSIFKKSNEEEGEKKNPLRSGGSPNDELQSKAKSCRQKDATPQRKHPAGLELRDECLLSRTARLALRYDPNPGIENHETSYAETSGDD